MAVGGGDGWSGQSLQNRYKLIRLIKQRFFGFSKVTVDGEGRPKDFSARINSVNFGTVRRQARVVTFDLQLRRVPNLRGGIAGHAGKIAGVSRVKARNAQEARVRVKG